MAKKRSTTAIAMDKLKADGYLADKVEQRVPGCMVSRDLFNCIDIIAIGMGETLAVQVTDHTSVSKRVRKVLESEAMPYMRGAKWRVQVWGIKDQQVYRIEELA